MRRTRLVREKHKYEPEVFDEVAIQSRITPEHTCQSNVGEEEQAPPSSQKHCTRKASKSSNNSRSVASKTSRNRSASSTVPTTTPYPAELPSQLRTQLRQEQLARGSLLALTSVWTPTIKKTDVPIAHECQSRQTSTLPRVPARRKTHPHQNQRLTLPL